MNTTRNTIKTGLGEFSKEKFAALTDLRANTLKAFRDELTDRGYTEVTTASLVNIAGSCENPHASFTLNYYGRDAHLSQSAQLQLEALVLRLKKGFFTVNNSFREENYDDPDAEGRRLSEFTLIEPEPPYEGLTAEQALEQIIKTEEEIAKAVLKQVLAKNETDIALLGGQVDYLKSVLDKPFNRITYDEALKLLSKGGKKYAFGDDLNIKEEREILAHFDNTPTFITLYPAEIKFFNMKRTPDGKRVFSVDLIMPRLGETIGSAVREDDADKIKQYLMSSKVGKFLRDKNQNPLEQFKEYFNLFNQEEAILRGVFGVGFERFIAFLINSNDILDTIAYRHLTP